MAIGLELLVPDLFSAVLVSVISISLITVLY